MDDVPLLMFNDVWVTVG